MSASGPSQLRSSKEIFFEALDIDDADQREAFLRGACGQNPVLKSQVDALLAKHFQGNNFMEEPVVETDPELASSLPLSEGPGATIGPYKLLQKVGEGGFGVVYMAEQKVPIKRRVALKIIKLGMDTKEVVGRFEAERQALALMDHPNIAKVLDGGATESGRPYFAMELVRGIPITEYCDVNQLSTKERLQLFITVCLAVQHAHQKGIIHRDLKPSNILVTLHDGVPVPKVIDFGIAKAMQQELTDKTLFTQFQQFIGTPAYISPEQAEMSGLDIDTRSDIYSLGVMLYELLVGCTPLDAKELTQGGMDAMRKAIREKEPLKPSTKLTQQLGIANMSRRKSTHGLAVPTQEEINADSRRRLRLKEQIALLRGDLDWIVMKALEKDRTRRYDTAGDFARDVQRYLAHEPVTAVPPSRSYLLRKYIHRHKAPLAVAVTILCLLVLGVTVSAILAFKATRAQRQAEQAEGIAVEQKGVAQDRQREAEQAKDETDKLLYIANMNLAQAAFEENNFANVQHLLDETATSPRRGFEWYYWQKQLHSEFKAMRTGYGANKEMNLANMDRIQQLVFSPDGRLLASGNESGLVQVWEVATGREMASFSMEHCIRSLDFSPDGQRLLSGCYVWNYTSPPRIRISDSLTGAPVLSDLVGFGRGKFSPDGRRVAVYSRTKLEILDAATGAAMLSVLDLEDPGHGSKGSFGDTPIWYSRDGRSLMTWHRQEFRSWDAQTGQPRELSAISANFNGICADVSPDFQWLVVGNYFGVNQLWNLRTGQPVAETSFDEQGRNYDFVGHQAHIQALQFSPDGKYLLTGSSDRTARIWDVSRRKEICVLPGHDTQVYEVAWSPDDQWLATGDDTGTVRVWKTREFLAPGQSQGLEPSVWSGGQSYHFVKVSPDGKRILAEDGERPATTILWDAATGEPIGRFEREDSVRNYFSEIHIADISEDGRLVMDCRYIIADQSPHVQVWSSSGQRQFVLDGLTNGVNSVRFSPDSRYLLTCDRASPGVHGTAKIWSATTGRLIRTLDHGTASVENAIVSPDGKRIVTTASVPTWIHDHDPEDGGHRVWDAGSGRELSHRSERGSVLDFSPDGKRYVQVEGSMLVEYEVEPHRKVTTFTGHKNSISSVSYSPDGSRLLSSGHDLTAKLWDVETGRELLTLKGHTKNVTDAAFFPDGQRIVTCSWDGTIRFWETANPSQIEGWETEAQIHAERKQVQAAECARLQSEVAALERSHAAVRAADPGAIKQWLILGPVPLRDAGGVKALDQEQILGEARLSPRAGDRAVVHGAELNWTPLDQESYFIDFKELFPAPYDYQMAYAVSYVWSERPQTNLRLKVGSDDQSKIYLNQREVYRWIHSRGYAPDQDVVPGISLRAGLNVLVFKVINVYDKWGGSIWITDAQGNPVPGLKVTTDPGAVLP